MLATHPHPHLHSYLIITPNLNIIPKLTLNTKPNSHCNHMLTHPMPNANLKPNPNTKDNP